MSRNKAWELINKKKKRIQEHRERKFRGPKSIVCEFINNMDDALAECETADAFYMTMQTHTNTMEKRMKFLDPGVNLEVVWADKNKMSTEEEEWKYLRVDAVKVVWSRWYLGKNPFSDPEIYIDVGQLFVEGFFSDREQ